MVAAAPVSAAHRRLCDFRLPERFHTAAFFCRRPDGRGFPFRDPAVIIPPAASGNFARFGRMRAKFAGTDGCGSVCNERLFPPRYSFPKQTKPPNYKFGGLLGATGRTCKEPRTRRRNSDRCAAGLPYGRQSQTPIASRHFDSTGRSATAKPPNFHSGACLELLAGLVRSRERGDGTAIVAPRVCHTESEAKRRSRHVISAIRAGARQQSPRTFIRGLAWSYWPDLNRRPADYEGGKAPQKHNILCLNKNNNTIYSSKEVNFSSTILDNTPRQCSPRGFHIMARR